MFPNLNGIRGMYPVKKLIHILQYASIKVKLKYTVQNQGYDLVTHVVK